MPPVRHAVAAAVGLTALLSCPAVSGEEAFPGREFSATFRMKDERGERQMGATILIDRLTPLEEARALKEVLKSQGQYGLANALKGRANGRLRLGALDYPLDLVMARPVRDGFHVVVVTTRPIRLEESQEGAASLDYPFGVVAIELDSFGRGEGRFFRTAALRINEDGTVAVEQFAEGEGTVTDVKKVR